MKCKKMEDALDHIDPKHIAEAAAPVKKKKKALPWIGAAAAVLALVLALSVIAVASAEEAGSIYYLNFKPEVAEAWEALAAAYTEETGVEMTVITAVTSNIEYVFGVCVISLLNPSMSLFAQSALIKSTS